MDAKILFCRLTISSEPLSVNEASLLSNVVRAYLEKLAADQAILRNPLTDQTVATCSDQANSSFGWRAAAKRTNVARFQSR